MNFFLFDASALVKRYTPESGSALVDHLFGQVVGTRLACLMLGAAEVAAALVRKRNGGQLTPAMYTNAMGGLRTGILNAPNFTKFAADNLLIDTSIPLLERHSINSSNAILLQKAIDYALALRGAGDDLVLVASDQRLLRAAQAEGLTTFDPETQPQPDLDALIGP